MKTLFYRSLSFLFIILLNLSSMQTSKLYAESPLETAEEIRLFVEKSLRLVIEDMEVSDSVYEAYFSKDYIQHVDGKTLNYADLVHHMKAQKAILASAKVTFKYIIVEGETVATLHYVDAIKKDGSSLRVQVNAVFRLKDHQFILCDELTRLVKGGKEDEAIGSCH